MVLPKMDRRRSIEGDQRSEKKERRRRRRRRREEETEPLPSPPVVARELSRPAPASDFSPVRGDGTSPARGERSRRRRRAIFLPCEETEHLPAWGERSRRLPINSDPVADKSTYSELACWMSASRTLRESLNDFRMETRNICAGNHPAATRNPDPIPPPPPRLQFLVPPNPSGASYPSLLLAFVALLQRGSKLRHDRQTLSRFVALEEGE
ncbi:hypothetical protein BHE74_00045877 [Ensete ventricosum]|nr:hypothetical protein BHE74_00045877 [Ensete ventricosum]